MNDEQTLRVQEMLAQLPMLENEMQRLTRERDSLQEEYKELEKGQKDVGKKRKRETREFVMIEEPETTIEETEALEKMIEEDIEAHVCVFLS